MIDRGTPKEYTNVMTMLYFITQLGNAKKVTSTLDSILKRSATDFNTYVKDGSVAKFKNKMHYLYNIQIQAEIPSNLFISRVTENPKRFPSFRIFLNSA